MKNADKWRPTKLIIKNRSLVASPDPAQVGVASRLGATLVAGLYWKYLKVYARGRLIDLGCGHVPMYEAYRDLVDEIICVDWANTAHKNEFIDYECDLTKDIPLPDNRFDTIILSAVLEHIPEPANLWKEMTRMLSPGGCIILDVPFFYNVHEAPHDYYRYTEFALRRFAASEGLEVLVIEQVGGVPEVLADIIAKNLMYAGRLGVLAARLIQHLCFNFVRTGFGKRLSRRTSEAFPYGYFMIVAKPPAAEWDRKL